jgi:adenosylcobinamide kinase/adenosylcobinamide-phosphate guanylyltransferase
MSEHPHPRVILVLGGARSGKSAFGQALAERSWQRPLYLATAEARDAEMAERIRLHQQARGPRWSTAEAPLEVPAALVSARPECDGVLLDCATLWLTNVVLGEGFDAYPRRRDELLASLKDCGRGVIAISNEVGLGIVPETELGRRFRDVAGLLNQALARAADTVVFVAAGLPLVLKGRIPDLGKESP